jgi:hypothetical protein
LERAALSVGDTTVSSDELLVDVPGTVSDEEDERRALFLLYVGLFDLLAGKELDALDDPRRAAELLARVAADVRAAEPPVRFARHERGRMTDRRELLARMRGREVAVTNAWLIPRLRSDIDAYRARIGALQRALASEDG